jgi:hypothetical protein
MLQRGDGKSFESALAPRRSADAAECGAGNGHYRANGTQLAPDALLLRGLGCARVSKNGEPVIEIEGLAGEHAMTVGEVERLALAEPEHEWCIHIVNLLDDRHYRREGTGVWKMYARGYGLS